MNLLGIDVPLWALLLLVVLCVYYKYLTWHYGDLAKIGVKGPRPIPFVGTNLRMFRKGFICQLYEQIEKYGKVFGTFMGRTPSIMIADLDMLREILVKRFDCFQNRRVIAGMDPPLNKMLTVLKDDHWKHVRQLLSPTFSAVKLKKMNGLINHAGAVLLKNLHAKAEKNETVEFRQTAGYFTMDVIGSTAFGILIDSQSNPEDPFIKMANKAMQPSIWSIRMLLFLFAPGAFKYVRRFGITTFDEDVKDFFVGMSRKAMETRSADGEKRTDLLQLMMDARSEDIDDNTDIGGVGGDVSHLAVDETGVWDTKALTEDEILAQCLVFFLAGYDTTSSMISFAIYNLAVNPDCQDALIEEIDRVMEGHTEPTYDLVNQMTYLDMCINESLRMYPQAPMTERVCQEDITIKGQFIPNEMVVAIPIQWLHYDPAVWPEPNVFKPERFSVEEKAARDPLSHMPFGYGPRSCIAMRLSLFECKMCLVTILPNFRLVTCAETQIPLELEKLRTAPVKGIKLKLEKRG